MKKVVHLFPLSVILAGLLLLFPAAGFARTGSPPLLPSPKAKSGPAAPLQGLSALAAAKVPAPAPATTSPSQWDDLVKAARKEGKVIIYGAEIAETRTPITQAFKEKYGISIEAVGGRPSEIIAKIKAERSAGLFLQDVGLIGNSSLIQDIKPLGITVPLDDLIILPEVKNPAKWRTGEIPFLDKDHHSIAMVAMAVPVVVRNTDLTKETQITSILDFLKPEWKGKFILSDPAIAGSANNFFTLLASKTFGMEKTLEFLRQLAAQEPAITRDQNLLLEWVARGKYPLAIGQSAAGFDRFKKTGAPITYVKLKEPPFISSGAGNLMVFDKAPHPNAAKLFVNWLLSKEGAAVWSPNHGYPSQRLDVSKEGWDPILVPPPGSNIPDESYLKLQGELRKVANDIFAPLRK